MLNCTVGVTGLNATDNPAPGIAVIRSLRDSPEWHGKIVGLAYDSLDTAIYDGLLLDEVYLLPYPSQGEGNLLQRLRQILPRCQLDVLIPTLDAELPNFSCIEDELCQMGVKMLLPSASQIKLRSKVSLHEFCSENGFLTPPTEVILDAPQIEAFGKKHGYPILVKGHFYEAEIAHSFQEAVVHFERLKSRWGLPVVVQKHLWGEEYDVAAMCDRQTGVIGEVAMRKLRLTDKGKAWAGVTVKDKALLSLATDILKTLRWVGPVELEFIRETSSGKYFLIEVNPRFPSWVYLAAAAGQNLPLAAVRLALGEEVTPFLSYQAGVLFVRHATDLICPLNYLEQLTVRGELIFDRINRMDRMKPNPVNPA